MKKLKFNKNVFFDVMSFFGFIYCVFFSIVIYTHLDVNGALVSPFAGNNTNFASFNKTIDDFFLNFFRFNNSSDDKAVSEEINYFQVDEHTFTTEDQQIKMLGDGLITYKVLEQNHTYSIIVNYGAVTATYFQVTNPSVDIEDHLLAGEKIGDYDESFQVYFQKDQKYITYIEAITAI